MAENDAEKDAGERLGAYVPELLGIGAIALVWLSIGVWLVAR